MNRYAKSLVRYVVALTREPMAAKNIVQDCFLDLLKQDQRPSREKIQAFLFKDCRRRAFEVRTKKIASQGTESEPVKLFVNPENLECQLLSELPFEQQEAIWLLFKERLSLREIGEVMDVGAEKAATLICDCLKNLANIQSDPNLHPPVTNRQLIGHLIGELEGEDSQLIPQLIKQNLETQRQAEELKLVYEQLQQSLAERAREGLTVAQISGLKSYIRPRPINWGPWALGGALATLCLMIFSMLPNDVFETSSAPAAQEEPIARPAASAPGAFAPMESRMTPAVPAELQREFSTPASSPTPAVSRALAAAPEPMSRGKTSPTGKASTKKPIASAKSKGTSVSKRDAIPKMPAKRTAKSSRKNKR